MTRRRNFFGEGFKRPWPELNFYMAGAFVKLFLPGMGKIAPGSLIGPTPFEKTGIEAYRNSSSMAVCTIGW
jgi:hypothetical protein